MRLGRLARQWIVCLLFWLLFVFQFSVKELLAGSAAATVCVIALQVGLNAVPLCFEPEFRWLAQGFRLPNMIAADLLLMLRILITRSDRKRVRGVWRQANFHTPDDCRGAAQRALATLFITTTPNSVVVDIDVPASRLLLHELVAAPLPKIVRKLQQ